MNLAVLPKIPLIRAGVYFACSFTDQRGGDSSWAKGEGAEEGGRIQETAKEAAEHHLSVDKETLPPVNLLRLLQRTTTSHKEMRKVTKEHSSLCVNVPRVRHLAVSVALGS